MQDPQSLVHDIAYRYHVSIRKKHTHLAQNRVREQNIKMLSEYRFSQLSEKHLSSLSSAQMADTLAFDACDLEFRAAIIDKSLEHLLLDKLMESGTKQEKATILRGTVEVVRNSIRKESLLVKEPKYAHFIVS